MSYTIVTDTSCNLPTPLLKKLGISVVPFSYIAQGRECTCEDTEAFDGKAFYDAIRRGEQITTAQINPQRYIDYLSPLMAQGQDILFINMSSGISGSFSSAQVAAEQLKQLFPERKIRLVDTLGASLGEGIPVLKAAALKAQQATLSAAADAMHGFCRHMCQIFLVDDLIHLKRTGRLSGAAAFLGSMLQIKPLLKGNEQGKIVTFGKVHGRRKAIEALANRYEKLVENAKEQIVGIAHADCEEDANFLARLLRAKNPPKDILTVCYEPVTGAHVGPGTLALFFAGKADVRSV